MTVATSDSELAQCQPDAVIALTGGNLWKSLGRPAPATIGSEATLVAIDAIEIIVTTEASSLNLKAAASIEIGKWFSRGRYIAVSNSSFIDRVNIAPRAHPNDGIFDIVNIAHTMSLRQRISAFRRAHTGTHLPHPDIQSSRVTSANFSRASRRESLRIDGVRCHNWSSIALTIRPDYWHVVI